MNGKNKGGSYERLISKKLSLWYSENEYDDIFYRTQSSGARYTLRKKVGKETHNQDADITSTHPVTELFIKKFSIELKHYRDIGFWNIITRGKGANVFTFLDEHVKTSKELSKEPILIFRQNYKPDVLITSTYLYEILAEQGISPLLIIVIDNEYLYLYLLDDFFKSDPKKIQTLLNNESVKEPR